MQSATCVVCAAAGLPAHPEVPPWMRPAAGGAGLPAAAVCVRTRTGWSSARSAPKPTVRPLSTSSMVSGTLWCPPLVPVGALTAGLGRTMPGAAGVTSTEGGASTAGPPLVRKPAGVRSGVPEVPYTSEMLFLLLLLVVLTILAFAACCQQRALLAAAPTTTQQHTGTHLPEPAWLAPSTRCKRAQYTGD